MPALPPPLPPKSASRTSTPRATPPSSSSSRLNPESPLTPSAQRRLPTASPPSARLRRLAPTPVKIPPTPPLPASLSLKTYRQWTTSAGGAGVGGSPGKKRKGSIPSLTLPRRISDGEEEAEEEEEVHSDDDPFDLDIAFAAPPTASPLSYPSESHSTSSRSPQDEPCSHLPRPIPNRQSSCKSSGTASTYPSFSTSPVFHSKNKATLSTLLPSSATSHYTISDRASLPPGGRSRTTTSRSSRTIPDVPDEILDLDDLSGGHSRSRSNRQSGVWSGSDEDARAPTRRTGDELLSPGAFLAAHVPRPVLVQFRDVFGANDTFSPHLPAGVWTSPVPSPATAVPTSPGSRGWTGRVGQTPMQEPRYEPLGSSPRSPPATRPVGKSPGGISLAESFATFGVRQRGSPDVERRGRTREESGNSDAGSFTFSAYLADDDPVRDEVRRRAMEEEAERVEGKGKGKAKEVGMGMSKGKSSKPVQRSTVPVHEPKAPEHRTHTHTRPRPPAVASSSSTPAGNAYMRPFQALPTDTPDFVSGQRDPRWIHPFARTSPASSDEGEELVTPEQRDQPLVPALASTDSGGSSGSARPYNPDDFGTPTPTPRMREFARVHGLGIDLDPQPPRPAVDPTHPMAGFFQRGNPAPVVPVQKVPKWMKEDYQYALESQTTFGLAGDIDGHPKALPQYPYPYTNAEGKKAAGPKKFKSLVSLRRRLPSSRGGPLPPVPTLPESRSGESLAAVEYISLTGKPAPSRPSTSARPPTSQNVPPPVGDSFFDWGGDTPPGTARSMAFSINSAGTATTMSSLGRVTAAHVVGVRKPVIEEKADGWKGGLKADLFVEGVSVPMGMTMNLWADQENCRGNISTLRPIRWHPPTRTRTRALDRIDGILTEKRTYDELDDILDDSHDEGNVFWEEGCVEFGMNPRNRDKWAFSYGALEALPNLRRVTFDGKQNLDFTSRNATLKHRVRGIYAVCGDEKHGARWRFRYMVDIPNGTDNRARIIVPMSFYANPAFIQGCHASKLGFAHMVGKAMRPNLQAEKLSTPELESGSKLGPPVPVPDKKRPAVSRPGTAASAVSRFPPLAVTVRIDTVVDREMTPRQPAVRQYRAGTADSASGGTGQIGESSPLIPKARPFGSPQVSATRSPRPATAQEPRHNVPLSSLGYNPVFSRYNGSELDIPTSSHIRARPGTAAAVPSLAQLDKKRVAPFLANEPPTPTTQPPSSRLGPFGRSRALTSGARPSTANTSTYLPPVPESATAKPSLTMRAKKSLSALRPPSRPGTAGMPISRPFNPPLPASFSADILGLKAEPVTRSRAKSSGPVRPSTAGGPPPSSYHNPSARPTPSTASLLSAFSRSARPSTANPTPLSTSTAPKTPHRPPTAPHTEPLQFGFGSYVTTPPSGVTVSALAMQQLEQREPAGAGAVGDFYARERELSMGASGSGSGSGLRVGQAGKGLRARADMAERTERRPRTATVGAGEGRKVSGTMI